MSYRAGLSGFAFPASWRTGAGDNFCPSVSCCWRPLHSNPRRHLEAARQSPPQLGSALAVVAPWWSSRNSPLNRSAGDLLTGSLSLTVRSWHSSLEPTACYGTRVLRVPIRASTCPIRRKTRPIQASRPVGATVLPAGQRTLFPHGRKPPVPELSQSD